MGACGLLFAFLVLHESHPRVKNKKKNDDDDIDIDQTTANSDIIAPDIEMDRLERAERMGSQSKEAQVANASDSTIPHEVWVLGLLNLSNMIAWTSYTSMFALYAIDKFKVSEIAIGYITLGLATLFVFSNIVLYSNMIKKFGVYVTALIGLSIYTVFLAVFPLPNNVWPSLILIGIGAGIGNGLVFPSMSAMCADFTNALNRGKILAFNNASQNLGFVIGPLLHGIIYESNEDLVFYESAAFAFVAFLTLLYLLMKHPRLRKPIQIDATKISKTHKQEEEWKWIPDKPTDDDYIRLGKYFGKLLLKRNYNWVSHFDPFTEWLKDAYPTVRISSLDEHIQDIDYLRCKIKHVRTEYDGIHNAKHGTGNIYS